MAGTRNIPESEMRITFARSSGAGGQNVNKVSSKVFVHWSIIDSNIFSDEEKNRIRIKLVNRINSDDEIVISAEDERSQLQNRENAIVRLHELVADAVYVPKKRKPSKPSRASVKKNVEKQKKRKDVKKLRKKII